MRNLHLQYQSFVNKIIHLSILQFLVTLYIRITCGNLRYQNYRSQRHLRFLTSLLALPISNKLPYELSSALRSLQLTSLRSPS